MPIYLFHFCCRMIGVIPVCVNGWTAGFWCHMSLDNDLGGRLNIKTNWLEDSVGFGGFKLHTDANVCDERCMDGYLSPSSSDSRAPCKPVKLHRYSENHRKRQKWTESSVSAITYKFSNSSEGVCFKGPMCAVKNNNVKQKLMQKFIFFFSWCCTIVRCFSCTFYSLPGMFTTHFLNLIFLTI